MNEALAERLDAVLPQTQCTRCGYDACRPYANAIASGDADVNRCPPGGTATIAALAAIAGRPMRALDPACGAHTTLAVAKIDEARCIGCTLCLDACPVDAILGATKSMHVVLESLCAGCELCIAPCPVDCIEMIPAGRDWCQSDANAARRRHDARQARLARAESISSRGSVVRPDSRARRLATVAAALERARARRAR